ncbi:flagella basal body P-ring formation protein FlgA [Methylocella silvestris BL2]|uniref:Flagella basal body P-ring formation protein FlgA n=1 Tax=Methylocella silvestris (strain DSM 15510 / CIP 108128 / LMG 27833 / NCIMB 13906 / BL2) TaxID=395965 RepID=B8EL16_METSB|nr:flagellar basal body P-ring formation chaperone FlgA [Methylocella silvestris]ACK49011.1 flagella basal body P-ring formation protein FlgA [Methylocella silvestris BL2]
MVGFVAICLFGRIPAHAAESHALPVPAITIYPGDPIKDEWLVDRDFGATSPLRGNVVTNRSAIIGKIARRTLLPGAPIPANVVAERKIVGNGTKVRIVFEQPGIEIATYGAALQDGALGDVISLRNIETGLTVTGVVQADGSVRVNGG